MPLEVDVRTAGIDEEIAVPVDQSQLGQAELPCVESGIRRRTSNPGAWRSSPVSLYDTSGTGARHRGAWRWCRRPASRGPVPAYVGEGAHAAVLAAHQKDPSCPSRRPSAPRRPRGPPAWPTQCQPPKMFRFSHSENSRVDVGLPRQHAGLSERGQGGGEIVGRNRGGILFEHTVRLDVRGSRSRDRRSQASPANAAIPCPPCHRRESSSGTPGIRW